MLTQLMDEKNNRQHAQDIKTQPLFQPLFIFKLVEAESLCLDVAGGIILCYQEDSLHQKLETFIGGELILW